MAIPPHTERHDPNPHHTEPGRAKPTRAAQPPGGQLSLLPEPGWRLDERTRRIGLEGVASARAALRRATSGRHAPTDRHHRHAA
jgi:hypothetical protein